MLVQLDGRRRLVRGRVVVSAAGISRPAGVVRRVARTLAGHAQPHRRAAAVAGRRDALPPPARLLPAAVRQRLRASSPTVLRRPPAAASVLSRPVT